MSNFWTFFKRLFPHTQMENRSMLIGLIYIPYFSREGEFSSSACKIPFVAHHRLHFLKWCLHDTKLLIYWNYEMQIMMYWDNMLYLLNIQLCHLPVILARILLTLDLYIRPPPTQVELYQRLQTSTIGMVHLCPVTYQLHTHFLPWIFTITAGNTTPLLSPQQVLV